MTKTKPVLTCAETQVVIDAAKQHAINNNWAVSIAIVDDGGHLLSLLRLDDAAPMTAAMATAKANAAALGRRETRVFEEIINQGRTAFLSAPAIGGLLEGGVPIVCQGSVVGAVGVSGVKSSEDAEIAKAGIAALGL